ncbi:protein mono-ADP-ribosyltransferase PARP4 isoform X3 [Phycodurus eques]|uniref:protein mono-ADP-ribosyltransferase PARP4 isoform X3 n=1 Tax=Phycodurus eques TaxID=693459 RepID=UPI002ACDBDC7|nr:protein mono-ADP-ribosyltransferase PARP4 isoform X3 [Phycodurus eques]
MSASETDMTDMAVFDKCSVLLDLKNLPLKERKSLKLSVTENGGNLCFVVTKQCSFVVVSNVSHLSSNRLRSIHRFQTPVVGLEYVHSCLQRGVLQPVEDYKLDVSSFDTFSHMLPLSSTKPSPFKDQVIGAIVKPSKDEPSPPDKIGRVPDKFRIYKEQDEDILGYPDDFNVAKYSMFHKDDSRTWCVLELQSAKGKKGQQYRVICYWQDTVQSDMVTFPSTSEQAVEVFQTLTDTLLASGLRLMAIIPLQDQNLGSHALQQLLLEEKVNAGVLSQDVAVFVELLWTEALGCLGNILRVPVSKLCLTDVSRAEGLLIQAQRRLKEGKHDGVLSLLLEVYSLLPHITPNVACDAKLVSQKLDLCQLIRDILNVSEMTLRSPAPSCVGKFRALRCSIETVEPSCREYHTVLSLFRGRAMQIHQVLRVSRAVELQTFKSKFGNVKSLLHSSRASNFVGILSRGLLLPCVGVEHHGIERTDAGSLGNGIYFSDSMSTCLKYSKPSTTDGSRLLLVCDVALGRCLEFHQRDSTLTRAPEGHNSVHGVRRTATNYSEFEGDEYVVYSPEQVKLKYVVRFSVDGDQLKVFSPAVDTSTESCVPPADIAVFPDDDGVGSIKNPLDDVTAGLLDSAGQQLPLLAVHVKCKLMDLLSHVIIFQRYTNKSDVPIEAKYVFPLDDYAAVCGFEAFINGKHVVGQVKEKEQARKEYKRAIEKGHGAYLMDQDAPDVFTISVGNLPAGASVLIKVTFVSELIVKDGSVFFTLPASVAPWQQSAALNQTTQVTVDKVCVTDNAASTREFSLDMSIEMPYEISSLQCITHKVKIKRTDCKAVVSVLPGQVMTPEGFQLSVTLSEVHLPRMWVEKHPDKDSQACMLVFYPNFEMKPTSGADEVVILLDTSESMRGEPLLWAQRIAQHAIKTLKGDLKINIVLFGTDHTQAFLTPQPLDEARQAAENFIKSLSPVGGSTELWRPLQALALLPPSSGVRNLFLLSDGHLQNADVTMKLLRDNVEHSRLFTCGISSTANRHMLRTLAQAGCGAYEYFDAKNKYEWAEKVACQVRRMASPGCSSVSVKWQQFNPSAPPPVQAPKQLHALFNDCHTLVYGFVPHCTQATLLGNLSGQELRTMVSTSELQKTRGTFLHKLTARALIRDYEDGNLDSNEAEHEGMKNQLKSFIIDLSKEFSILSQFTSFVAIEEREAVQEGEGFTDVPKLLAEEDVDILPYINWASPQAGIEDEEEDNMGICDDLFGFLHSVMSHHLDSVSQPDFIGSLAYSSTSPSLASSLSSSEMFYQNTCGFETPPKRAIAKRPNLKGIAAGFGLMDTNVSHTSLSVEGAFSTSSFQSLDAPPTSAATSDPNVNKPPPGSLSEVHRFLCSASCAPLPVSHPSSVIPPPVGQPSFVAHPLPHFDLSASAPSPPPPGSLFVPPPPPPVDRLSFVRRQSFGQLSFPAHPLPHFVRESSALPPPPPPGSPSFVPLPPPLPVGCPSFFAYPPPSVGHPPFVGFPPPPPPISVSFDAPPPPPGHPSITVFGSSTPSLGLAASTYEKKEKKTKFQYKTSTQRENKSSAVGFSFGGQAASKAELAKVQQKDDFGSRNFASAMPKLKVAHHTLLPMYGSATSCGAESAGGVDYIMHKLKWSKIFPMQTSDGYWELTTELGKCVNIDLDVFANVFLENKGIRSLGVKARANILRLLATLLVLQLMRLEKLPEGALLRTLFCLEDTPVRPPHWQNVKKAVYWVRWADRQYPCICSRLEFGFTWESASRQLLGYDALPAFSPLASLELRSNILAAVVVG